MSLQFGMRQFGFGQRRGGCGAQTLLQQMQARADNGDFTAWYDPSDLTTLWKDVAGTSPVTADGDLVARMDDKSGNGYNATQATEVRRPVYKTSGGLHWLLFDGIDDGMATGTIDLDGTDKISILAALEKHSNASLAVFAELSASYVSNRGAFLIAAPHSGGGEYGVGTRGNGNYTGWEVADASVDTPRVLHAQFDYDGGTTRELETPVLRMDGSDVALTTPLGSYSDNDGTFDNYPLYLGRRGGSSLPFNGRMYGFLLTPTVTSADDYALYEQFLADRSGVTLA